MITVISRKIGFMLSIILAMGVAWFSRRSLPTPLVIGTPLMIVILAHWSLFRWHSRWRRVIGISLLLVAGCPFTLGAYQVACLYSPHPEPTSERLFLGVQYIREVIKEPHSAVVHILRVDLSTDGVEVLVTPPDDPTSKLPLRRKTTSRFLREYGVQAAVNGSNHFPFERGLASIQDRIAQSPAGVIGGAASSGVQYGEPSTHYPILHIGPDNRATIEKNKPRPWHNAIAGIKHFIIDGKPIHLGKNLARHPTTTVGIDRTGRILFLVVVDGRQAPYSIGLDRRELTQLLQRHGVYNALSLDGGGSSTMVVESPNGGARTLNRPINANIPGLQRAVGNHLGIRARRIDE